MLPYLDILILTKTNLLQQVSKVLIHNKQRKTWGTHALDGWYVELSLQHYRCYICIISITGGIRDVATIGFIPHQTPIASATPDTYLHQAAMDLLSIPNTTYSHTWTHVWYTYN